MDPTNQPQQQQPDPWLAAKESLAASRPELQQANGFDVVERVGELLRDYPHIKFDQQVIRSVIEDAFRSDGQQIRFNGASASSCFLPGVVTRPAPLEPNYLDKTIRVPDFSEETAPVLEIPIEKAVVISKGESENADGVFLTTKEGDDRLWAVKVMPAERPERIVAAEILAYQLGAAAGLGEYGGSGKLPDGRYFFLMAPIAVTEPEVRSGLSKQASEDLSTCWARLTELGLGVNVSIAKTVDDGLLPLDFGNIERNILGSLSVVAASRAGQDITAAEVRTRLSARRTIPPPSFENMRTLRFVIFVTQQADLFRPFTTSACKNCGL